MIRYDSECHLAHDENVITSCPGVKADFGFDPDIPNSALAFVSDWQHDCDCGVLLSPRRFGRLGMICVELRPQSQNVAAGDLPVDLRLRVARSGAGVA